MVPEIISDMKEKFVDQISVNEHPKAKNRQSRISSRYDGGEWQSKDDFLIQSSSVFLGSKSSTNLR
jgi:hypothetical protein